jgi:lambda repressor-like predicted transcriptional regulator
MDDSFLNARDRLEERLLGKAGVRAKRQREELEHERQLAAIRTQSHALTWTGTSEELTETIKQWYESRLLTAESLQDALQKAAVHFTGPDGKAVIKPTSAEPSQAESKKKLSRREFVTPLLKAKGWSPLDWALEATVAPATANDYLANKTNPYRSTRLKLAKALGVPVEQLPK